MNFTVKNTKYEVVLLQVVLTGLYNLFFLRNIGMAFLPMGWSTPNHISARKGYPTPFPTTEEVRLYEVKNAVDRDFTLVMCLLNYRK